MVLVRKYEGKKLFGRRRCRSGDNIKIDIKGVGLEGVDWNDMVQYRDKWRAVVSTVTKLRSLGGEGEKLFTRAKQLQVFAPWSWLFG